jgi:hypothetical protein
MLAADDKSTLHHVWNHGNTLGGIQHFLRDAFIGRGHDLIHNLTGRL